VIDSMFIWLHCC